MKVAIASGKGGTGKTTVATNLAHLACGHGLSVAYVDCDVEEPNGHIFLKPEIESTEPVGNLVPQVDAERCTHCGECGRVCQYNAITCVGEKVLVFPELCHGCGGCTRICPSGAITESMREMGLLEQGRRGAMTFIHGRLNVGEVMSPPIIRAVREACPAVDLAILDAPPGTSCPVIESIRGCDFIVLVTEPTPFGLNDLKLAVEMVRTLQMPFGVVINRSDVGDRQVHEYCADEGIEILAEIPNDRGLAEAYSRGELAAEVSPALRERFEELLAVVREKTGGDPAGGKV